MQKLYTLLTGLLLAAGPATAQVLHPAQTIALGPHTTVGGTVVLPNHNTVLLLTDSEAPTIVAQCLAPDGRTLWKTSLMRYQRPDYSIYLLFDTREIALGERARADKQLRKEASAARLQPVNVFTDGNEVVLAETLTKEGIKKQPAGSSAKLVENQVLVQRLDEQGHLTKHLFEPRPEPEAKKVESLTLGYYADAAGYAEVVREINKREEKTAFYIQHYDLESHSLRRENLDLPATPEHVGGMNGFRHWYQEWAYLGHRPGQTYFCRRTLVNGPDEKAGRQPLNYQVYIADDHGRPASPSGFTTTLGLSKGTRPAYSGRLPSAGELNHIPNYYDQQVGKRYVTYDEWNTSTGGTGTFCLDYATGDVLIVGEYGEGDLPEARELELLGFFMRRYSAGGQALAQSQTLYTEAMREFKRRASFKGFYDRNTYFHTDPLTGQYQFTVSTLPDRGNHETYDFYFDHGLNLLRYDHPVPKPKNDPTLTFLTFVQPFDIATNYSSSYDLRVYEHADKADPPVYAAIEKQRHTAAQDMPYYRFFLSPTGPSTGLVLEQPQVVGGALKVYTF